MKKTKFLDGNKRENKRERKEKKEQKRNKEKTNFLN